MEKILKMIWPSVIWTALVFILLSMDADSLGGSGLMKVKGADKVVHFILFLCFSFFWSCYLSLSHQVNQNRLLIWVIICGSVYGLGMEYYQLYFTSRSFSYWDAVTDAAGAVAGGWMAKKSPYRNRGRNQN